MTNRKVIAGPAGHWYAVWSDWQFGDTLIGLPMSADDDPANLPPYPDDTPSVDSGWYEITDPAPETDDAALIAELTISRCPDCGGEPTPEGRGTEEDEETTGDPCTHPCHDRAEA